MNRLIPREELAKAVCPECGMPCNASAMVRGDYIAPMVGELAICVRRYSVLEYAEDFRLVKLTPEQLAKLPMITRDGLNNAINHLREDRQMRQKFETQCNQMLANAKAWRAANAEREVLIQYNYPSKVAIIQAISQALHTKTVTTNEAGLDLIKALWPWDESEPTVNMVRVVLEREDKPNETK